ncbi:REP-associated tyrosine transposase [Pseudoduganella armeniaca]|uniref:Addiction module toxin RelE n=1 Tax=Pseudoduganella armeniaca TaxID=2072590 RepID=A0A2R4C789_9BURK|nr:transposase [Pseudoduganella armeniaca]AVR95479.1 addiction module toxin RelE [Pseudoduganella armeniaca]
MSRPPRTLFPGAIYHVTSRGNRRANIYADERDHLIWLDVLAETAQRYDFKVHAYCMMPNHYHLLVETPSANLSEGMRFLNGRYASRHNDRHGLVGHVIQGRYFAVLVERDAQLLEAVRYISLNPVRAQLVSRAADWRWSSHCYMTGAAAVPPWMSLEWLLDHFYGKSPAEQAEAFSVFVDAGLREPSPFSKKLTKSRCLEAFDARPSPTSTNAAIASAYATGQFTRAELAAHFGVSVKTVSRAISDQASSNTAEPVSRFGD